MFIQLQWVEFEFNRFKKVLDSVGRSKYKCRVLCYDKITVMYERNLYYKPKKISGYYTAPSYPGFC